MADDTQEPKQVPEGLPERSTVDYPQGAAIDTYRQLLVLAAQYKHQKHYRKALMVYEDILLRAERDIPPEDVIFIRGEAALMAFSLGDYRLARLHAQETLVALREHDDPSKGPQDKAYEVLGKVCIAEFQFREAREYFNKMSLDHPGRAKGHCLVCIKVRDIKGAVASLSEARKYADPTDPELALLTAYCDLLKGGTQKSVRQVRKLLKEYDDGQGGSRLDVQVLLLCAEIFMTAGCYAEAAQLAGMVAESAPEHDMVFAIQAHVAYAEGNYAEAEIVAKKAIERNPRNQYAQTVLMKTAARSGDYLRAEQIGQKMLQESPEYSLGHANLGDVYFNQGDYRKAKIHYEKTEQLMNSHTKGAMLRTARMKFIDGEYAQAARILETMVDGLHTYYDEAMCDLLLCYEKLNDPQKTKDLVAKMQFRKTFYHRTEQLLKSFHLDESGEKKGRGDAA